MTYEMTYDDAMNAGQDCMSRLEWATAYRHFGRAHGLGHDVLRQHLAAHRCLIRAAWRGGRPDRAAQNVVLLALAWMFDKDASDPRRKFAQ